MTARTIIFLLNETLLLGESVTLSYWGTLDDQYFIAHSGVEQLLTTTTDYTGVEHNAAALFSVSGVHTMYVLMGHTFTLYVCNILLAAVCDIRSMYILHARYSSNTHMHTYVHFTQGGA